MLVPRFEIFACKWAAYNSARECSTRAGVPLSRVWAGGVARRVTEGKQGARMLRTNRKLVLARRSPSRAPNDHGKSGRASVAGLTSGLRNDRSGNRSWSRRSPTSMSSARNGPRVPRRVPTRWRAPLHHEFTSCRFGLHKRLLHS
jgi:hypothetical protein